MFDQNKPISFLLIPRTWLKLGDFVRVISLSLRHFSVWGRAYQDIYWSIHQYVIFKSLSSWYGCTGILSMEVKYDQFRTVTVTSQKMKFSIEYFFSKCDPIRRKLRIWPHVLKKSLMENFIFCAVSFYSNFNAKSDQLNPSPKTVRKRLKKSLVEIIL